MALLFSVWNHLQNNLFFKIWVMFWNINRIYFFIFSIKNIKSNCYIIFFIFFPIIFFWWNIYSFLVLFIYKRFDFCYSLQMFSYFFIIWRNCYNILKAFIFCFIDRIYCCFFVFYPISRIYMIHQNWDLFYEIYNTINEHIVVFLMSKNLGRVTF